MQEYTEGAGVAWWRRGRVWAVAGTIFALVGAQFAHRNAAELADWYADVSMRFLPSATSSLAPADTDNGAFVYCARQVARKMEGKSSVETFGGSDTRTVVLGAGRYRIESVVDEARVGGQQVRHDFTCTVRLEEGRWVLEELQVERYAASERAVRLVGNR